MTPPPPSKPTQKSSQTLHPVINKLQAHLAQLQKITTPKQPSAAQSTRQESFALPNVISTYNHFGQSPLIHEKPINSQQLPELSSHLTAPSYSIKNYYGNNFEGLTGNKYLPPGGPNGNTAENFVMQNLQSLKNGNTNPSVHQNIQFSFQHSIQDSHTFPPQFPTIPPSVLSPFFQNVQQHQSNDDDVKPTVEEISEVDDEFTRHLVPPPPYKHTDTIKFREKPSSTADTRPEENSESDLKPNFDIFNRFNFNNQSPLQDANRFSYSTGSSHRNPISSTIKTPTFSALLYPPTTDPPMDFNSFLTTIKPNIFKHLERPQHNEFKQHKVMHPSYTGAKRPLDMPTHTTFQPPPQQQHEENSAITHSFFTIEDAVTSAPVKSVNPIIDNQPDLKPPPVPSHRPLKNYEYNIEHFSHGDVISSGFDRPRDPESEYNVYEVSTHSPLPQNIYFESSTLAPRPPPPSPTTTTTTTTTSKTTTTLEPAFETEVSTPSTKVNIIRPRDKQKIRRRRPKPTQIQIDEQADNDLGTIQPTVHSNRHRHRGRPANHLFEDQTQATQQKHHHRHRRPQTTTAQTIFEEEPQTQQYHREVKRRPTTTTPSTTEFASSSLSSTYTQGTSTSQLSHFNQFNSIIPTAQTTSEVEILPNTIKHTSTPHNIIDETTLNDHYSSQPSTVRVRNGYTAAVTTTTQNDETTTFVHENDLPFETSTFGDSNNNNEVLTSTTIQNNYDHVRHLPRFNLKSKPSTAFEEVSVSSSNLPPQSVTISHFPPQILTSHLPVHVTTEDVNENETLPPVPKISRRPSTTPSTTTSTTTTTAAPQTKKIRIKPIGQFDANNRPRFSVKEYRQRLSSTTESPSTSTSPNEPFTHTRLRFPTRNRFLADLNKQRTKVPEDIVTTTTSTATVSEVPTSFVDEQQPTDVTEKPKKRFHLKDRTRRPISDYSTSTTTTTTTNRPTSRRQQANTRRDFALRNRFPSSTPGSVVKIESQVPIIRNSSIALRRPAKIGLRERIEQLRKKEEQKSDKTSDAIDDDTQEIIQNEQNHVDEYVDSVGQESATDAYHQETSIMKIAKDDHSYRPFAHSTEETSQATESEDNNDLTGSPSDYSQRVAELTLSANSEFKSVNTGLLSRRVPGYFTLATEDPILPIEAFFPAVKKD